MSDAAVNLLIGAALVAFGWVLNEGTQSYRTRKSTTTEREGVRAALELEYEHNRAALMDLWHRVTSDPMPGGTYDEQSLEKRYRLTSGTLPSWSHLMWESNAAKLTRVLSRDEFKLMLDLHASLDAFTIQVGAIREAFEAEAVKIYTRRGIPRLGGMLSSEDPNVRARVEDFDTLLSDTFLSWAKCDEVHTKFRGQEVAIKLDN
jgi:hypothetical protein